MFKSMGAAVYRPICVSSRKHRPGHVGAAVAIGAACGMLLTKSLLGPLLLISLYFLPIHLPVALIAVGLVAGFSGLCDPIAGILGGWCLKISPVRQWVAGMQAYPFAAWMRLNNTVVQGYLIIAMAQLLPTFLCIRQLMRSVRQASFTNSYPTFRVHEAHLSPPARKSRPMEASAVDEVAASNDQGRQDSEADNTQLASAVPTSCLPVVDTNSSLEETEEEPSESLADTIRTVHQAGSTLQPHSKTSRPTSAVGLRTQANQVVASQNSGNGDDGGGHLAKDSVTDSVTEVAAAVEQQKTDKVAEQLRQLLVESSGADSASVEEVATRASELADVVSNLLGELDSIKSNAGLSELSDSDSAVAEANDTGVESMSGLLDDEAVNSDAIMDTETADSKKPGAIPSATFDGDEGNSHCWQQVAEHEEALRYLLLHLKEIQEKV